MYFQKLQNEVISGKQTVSSNNLLIKQKHSQNCYNLLAEQSFSLIAYYVHSQIIQIGPRHCRRSSHLTER